VILNAEWNGDNKNRVLHRHLWFMSTDIKHIFNDCCGKCPVPSTPEEVVTQIEEDKIYVRGKIEFIKDDPGRQVIGSFHPLTEDDWTTEAYVDNVREVLCSACARGDVEVVKNLLEQNSLPSSQAEKVNVNVKDYLERTPLQLAVLGGHTEIVKILLQHDARIIERMSDGRTVVHLASQYGFLDILELLLQKSDENKKRVQEQKKLVKSLSEEKANDDDKIKIVQTQSKGHGQALDSEEEKEQVDIININDVTLNHLLAPLDYAILFGQVEIVKRLVKAEADVRRQIKIQPRDQYYRNNREWIYYPLGLCLLTQNQKDGLEIATILLENGAMASQVFIIHIFFFF
jgi:ankyrin repeat protein